MTGFSIKKSDLSVEGYFRRPGFSLLSPKSDLHSTISTFLSDFCLIQGDDIRINQDVNPLSNASVTYDLDRFNGFARVSIERSQLVLLSPHTLVHDTIVGLSLALLRGVQSEIDENSYANYFVQMSLHAEVKDVDPAVYTGRYVMPQPEELGPIIGNSITYYLGQEGSRTHSSVVLDMSGEFSECIFLKLALRYDASEIALDELPVATIEHCNRLLALVGLESE